MDPQVKHDPLTKSQIREALYLHLYGPMKKYSQARLDSIIIQNTLMTKASHKSFAYKGVLYSCDASTPPRRANLLHPEMRCTMNEYLKEMDVINNTEVPYVVGFINQVLNVSDNFCDYLDMLPSAVHHPIQQFINTCPCKTRHMTAEEVQAIQEKNATSIELMKSRMVTNLLIA